VKALREEKGVFSLDWERAGLGRKGRVFCGSCYLLGRAETVELEGGPKDESAGAVGP
jgi:hypothetical protein